MKTREQLANKILEKLAGEVHLTEPEREEIDYLVDRSLAGFAVPAGDNRLKIKVGAFHLPKAEEVLEHVRQAAEAAANEALAYALKETAYFWLRRGECLKGTIWLPLGTDGDEPEWTVDLEGEFKDFLENRVYPDTRTLDAKGFEGCKEIRDKLASIVSLYDEVLNKGIDHRTDEQVRE
jgi:hypothetical protein